ncbi:MAG: TPR repeat-containing protein YrrB [Candidatus Accumulibacter phosphatis]|jgi:Flp pilus assembly protein TadD|uniref:TPR repeat-containing protein YrrB n=1 Tax=Candidatus Accumulibacter phosphatis TaxID=327160 RepID=A0A080LVS8_9PROT|nr:tetratricopeptide repeat-containing glycosyltransferase family protein [Accumulibacter sp.]KFB72738.1 MAG: TPR repeat-containing protein YrrB [Candidatus Accumulibacter phosphatis]HCZ17313.1 hypothetical protein [Accumulibacter sp.]
MVDKVHGPLLFPGWRPGSISTKQLVANLLQRAKAQFQAGAHRDAGDTARRVLELDVKSADAYHLLGAIAVSEDNFAEAETLFSTAVNLNRNSAYLRYHLANVQRALGNHASAVVAYRHALRLDPNLSFAYFGLALALSSLGQVDDAVVYLQRYLQRKPGDADGHHELGRIFRESGNLDQALEHLRAAFRARPDDKAFLASLATTLLLTGNYLEGWPHWLQLFTRSPVRLPDPIADTAPFAGNHVVIYANEGVGDEVMFASCLPEISDQAAVVTLHCDRRLVSLFKRSFPSVRIFGMDKVGEQRIIGLVAPEEYHIFASFLPAYFRPDMACFPQRRSYLLADPALVAEWRRRFDGLGAGLKVGVSWLGGADPINRSKRSIPLSAWGEILAVNKVHFVNLQYGEVSAEIKRVRETFGVPIHTWPDVNPLLDLDFTAAQISALDLVISVDNSTVHLAGALGTPVWTLLPIVPDWRWRMAGTHTSWYPNMTLFRQAEAGHWGTILQQVGRSLNNPFPGTCKKKTPEVVDRR